MEKTVVCPLNSPVGFSSVPDQIIKRSTACGFNFNVLCVGETGLGKSTLLNSLFNDQFEWKTTGGHSNDAVTLKIHTHRLEEASVKLKLMLVETVGYGDQINQEECYSPIVNYVEAQHEAYLQEELKVHRSMTSYQDTRVHVCLYLIAPTGHGLRALDLVTMKKLDNKVNIIPIIAKSDTITKEELFQCKAKIMDDIKTNNIQVYQLPVDDEDTADINQRMNADLPFAVVASSEFTVVKGRAQRCRIYPWGTVFVEDENHSDLAKLREVIVRNNMEDLREKMETVHYEEYRRQRLESMGFSDLDANNQPQTFYASIEAKKLALLDELQSQEEKANTDYIQQVKEAEQRFAAAEENLAAKYQLLKEDENQLRKQIITARKKLGEEQNLFTMQRQQFLVSSQFSKNTNSPLKKKRSFDRRLTLRL